MQLEECMATQPLAAFRRQKISTVDMDFHPNDRYHWHQ